MDDDLFIIVHIYRGSGHRSVDDDHMPLSPKPVCRDNVVNVNERVVRCVVDVVVIKIATIGLHQTNQNSHTSSVIEHAFVPETDIKNTDKTRNGDMLNLQIENIGNITKNFGKQCMTHLTIYILM